MPKLADFRNRLFLSAFAIICVAGSICAQQGPAAPVIIDQKQASHLLVDKTEPEYPPVARINYVQGSVQLQVSVNGKGQVTSAHVVQGDAVLAVSALKAVRSWIYRPLTTPAGVVGFITSVRLRYILKSKPNDLTPQQAEKDFMRQVKPPEVLQPSQSTRPGDVMHLRLLVDAEGQVDDIESSSSESTQLDLARATLHGWTFRPAHWGNLAVPSYVDVDLPVNTPPAAPTN